MAQRPCARRSLLALIAVCASPPAFGYVRARSDTSGAFLFWRSPPLVLAPDIPTHVGSLDRNAILAALRHALAAWSHPAISCTSVRLSLAGGDRASAHPGKPGVVRILFRQDYWGRNGRDDVLSRYDPKMLAVTTLSAKKDGSGEIVSADIEINAISLSMDRLDGAQNGGGYKRPGDHADPRDWPRARPRPHVRRR